MNYDQFLDKQLDRITYLNRIRPLLNRMSENEFAHYVAVQLDKEEYDEEA